jgi:hypothetical protein
MAQKMKRFADEADVVTLSREVRLAEEEGLRPGGADPGAANGWTRASRDHL